MKDPRVLMFRETALRVVVPSHLNVLSLRVVALWNSGVTDWRQIVDCTVGDGSEKELSLLVQVVDALQSSTNKHIQEWIQSGLPSNVAIALRPNSKIFCHLCNSWINVVPCVRCNANSPKGKARKP